MKKEVIECNECRFLQQWTARDGSKFLRCGKNMIDLPEVHDYCSRAEKLVNTCTSNSLKEN